MKYKRKKKHLLLQGMLMAAIFLFLLVFLESKHGKISVDLPVTADGVVLEQTEQEEDVPPTEETAKDERATEVLALQQESERLLGLSAGEQAAMGMVSNELLDTLFFASEIDDDIFSRINGNSYTENETIGILELSYLRMLYYGFDGNTYVGEMIVNQKIEAAVLRIFRTLYENQYPIERMVLVDEYDANDEASMDANNTSAFNYRKIAGSDRLSNHSYGMAIDLNPKYNPYVKTTADGGVDCQPKSGMEYADRSREFSYKIDENDLAYQLFTEEGFTWGGNWSSVKDYQHFEKME